MPCMQGASPPGTSLTPGGLPEKKVRSSKGLLSYPKGPGAGRSFQEEEDREGTFLKARKRSSLRPGRMNESCGKRTLPDWHLSKSALEKMRKEKYMQNVPQRKHGLRFRETDT